MADRSPELDPYLAEHVHEALASDPRVSELGVHVEIAGETVVLRGTVSSPERQKAAIDLVQAMLPGHHVHDQTTVAETPEPAASEHLP